MSDQTQAEKVFLAFDWSKSAEWQKYFSDLYPTPPASRVLHFKKKWFKSNVDDTLSMDFNPDTTSSTSSNLPSSQTSTTQPTATPQTSLTRNFALRLVALCLLILGCLFSVLYLIPLGIANVFGYANFFFFLGFFLDVFSRYGRPQFNGQYWQTVLTDEYGQAIFMTIAVLGLKTWTALASPVLTAIMFIAQNQSLWLIYVPKIATSRLLPLVQRINSSVRMIAPLYDQCMIIRYSLMQLRANFEVMVGFTALVMIFVGKSNLMMVILYWNALRFRYYASPFTQSSFRLIDHALCSWLSARFCPTMFATAYHFMKKQLSKMVQPSNSE